MLATQAFKAYQDLAKIARATVNPAELPGLNLNAPMPKSAATFGPAADRLFTNAPNVEAEYAKIGAYKTAASRQDSAKGNAQNATQAQSAALQALNKWTAQYIKVARVALSAEPQLLEKLGVIARASPTAAQRAARQKKTATSPQNNASPESNSAPQG